MQVVTNAYTNHYYNSIAATYLMHTLMDFAYL